MDEWDTKTHVLYFKFDSLRKGINIDGVAYVIDIPVFLLNIARCIVNSICLLNGQQTRAGLL